MSIRTIDDILPPRLTMGRDVPVQRRREAGRKSGASDPARADVIHRAGTSGSVTGVWQSAKRKKADVGMTDAELIRLFKGGSDRDGAFMVLFERYAQVTHAFLRRRIGNAEAAAELNQDLYIAVLEGLDSFRGDSSFKTWLFRMAHNRLLNLRRRWRTHLDELPDAAPEDLVERIAEDETDQAGARIDRKRTVRYLAECMAALPEVERAVLVGQYFDGVTLEELTRRFNMTNKSGARASLIAGQRKLRRCLEKSGIDASAALDGRSG